MITGQTVWLRWLVLLLVLVNGAYYAWSEGLLRGAGLGPAVQGEPHRLETQVRPDALRLLRHAEAVDLAMGAACRRAGPFDETQADALRGALRGLLPAQTWSLDLVIEPASWIIYIGQYNDPATIEIKKAELRGLKLPHEAVTNPDLMLGLSLGRFESQAAAAAELESMKRRGLRKALVVQDRPERRGSMLRITGAEEAVASTWQALQPLLGGKVTADCR